jgi:hypothetical protein
VFFGRILNAMLAVTKEGSNTIKRNTFELNLNGIGIIHLPLLFSLLQTLLVLLVVMTILLVLLVVVLVVVVIFMVTSMFVCLVIWIYFWRSHV